MSLEIEQLVKSLSERLRTQKLKLATAESCTGGLIATSITEISGSSDVFDRGFVTYSNLSKIEMLGVHEETLEKFGAVSEETAREMVEGVLSNSEADIAVSVTGIAGPTGGSNEKPVGLVFTGVCKRNQSPLIYRHIFDGNRAEIRQKTVISALEYLIKLSTN